MVPVAAKAGVLLAVAAAGSTSVWYFSDSIFGTSLVSVAYESDQTPYQENSIGKKYGKYFLSSKNNKKIWEEKYEKNKSKFSTKDQDNKVKDKFVTVAKGYSDTENDTTALNKVCEAAYKDTTSANFSDNNEANKYTTEHIWKFCGLGDIVTLDKDSGNYPSSTFDENKIGGDTTNKKLFVSTKVDGNDWFWDLKSKDFWSTDKSKLVGNAQAGNEFKKLKEDSSKQNANIKEACEEAYKKGTSDDTNNKNKEDALTFCSIKLTFGTDD